MYVIKQDNTVFSRGNYFEGFSFLEGAHRGFINALGRKEKENASQ